MSGHQDDNKQDDTNGQVINDVSAFNAPVDASPAASPSVGAPAADTDAGNFLTEETVAPTAVSPTPSVGHGDLAVIKQSALQELTPLVGHLEQSPEEKFRTTMMMIQAADDSSLIKSAYDAAQQISDQKVKAQALLDIVNEINYFTQQQAA